MCAPNVCAEMLRRIFGAPNFVPMCVPNFGCAEFCAEFVCRILGAPNFSEKQFYLVKQLFYADKIRRINSAQNSAHPKFGTEFGAKFGAPKIRRNISAHTFGVHIGWIVCTRGPKPKDLGSLARPLGPGAQDDLFNISLTSKVDIEALMLQHVVFCVPDSWVRF